MENLHRTDADDSAGSSDRSFGLVFTIFFGVIGLWPLLHGAPVRVWAWAASGVFLLAALVRPQLLGPLNRLWTRFGLLLHHVVSPVAMGVIYFGAILPMGLLMRALGKRPLQLGFDHDAKSYWIPRDPPGPDSKTMSDPF